VDNDFGQALIAEAKRRIMDESVPRLKKCLAMLNEEEIWKRPNDRLVSVGNLVLHLCGNARQWIGSGLGGQPDHRERDKEFTARSSMPREELLDHLDTTIADVQRVLDNVDPATLLEHRNVQIYQETGLSIIVHVIEHFSYHVGQITYYTKLVKNADTGYYAGKDLSGKNE